MLHAPLPEFLSKYGKLLRPEDARGNAVLEVALLVVLALLALYSIGAVVQGIVKWYGRRRERRRSNKTNTRRASTDAG